tara:strand:+ start:55425 stop:56348 length:924 start_codon:yes stop_codon:yes gene_type:complete
MSDFESQEDFDLYDAHEDAAHEDVGTSSPVTAQIEIEDPSTQETLEVEIVIEFEVSATEMEGPFEFAAGGVDISSVKLNEEVSVAGQVYPVGTDVSELAEYVVDKQQGIEDASMNATEDVNIPTQNYPDSRIAFNLKNLKTSGKKSCSKGKCNFGKPKGKLDTQLFPECDGTQYDRDVVKKNRKRKTASHHCTKNTCPSCDDVMTCRCTTPKTNLTNDLCYDCKEASNSSWYKSAQLDPEEVFKESMPSKHCDCGSGLPREEKYDARNIFVFYYCHRCEEVKKSKYRSEIFTDPGYWADEEIEPDDY